MNYIVYVNFDSKSYTVEERVNSNTYKIILSSYEESSEYYKGMLIEYHDTFLVDLSRDYRHGYKPFETKQCVVKYLKILGIE